MLIACYDSSTNPILESYIDSFKSSAYLLHMIAPFCFLWSFSFLHLLFCSLPGTCLDSLSSLPVVESVFTGSSLPARSSALGLQEFRLKLAAVQTARLRKACCLSCSGLRVFSVSEVALARWAFLALCFSFWEDRSLEEKFRKVREQRFC